MSDRRPSPVEEPGSTSGQVATTPFETAMKRLAEIVQLLERGDLPLEESLGLFEEGVKLSRMAQTRLDAAERRVEQLLSVDGEGRARTSAFATDAQDDGADPAYRPIAPR